MTTVNAARPPSTTSTGYFPSKSTPASEQASLMPPPTLQTGDGLAEFLIMDGQMRKLSASASITNINSLRRQKKEAWEKQKTALMNAAQASHKSSFWGSLGKICGTIAKVAAVVASVAVAVGTGGAGLPLVLAVAGACLSAGALAQGEFHILQKLGMDDKTAGWVELGMSVGAVVCSAGASLASGSGTVTQFASVMKTGGQVGSVVGGVAAVGAGVSTIEGAEAQGEAQHEYADAAKSRLEESHLEQLLLNILDELDQSEKSQRRVVSNVKDLTNTRDITLEYAAGRA